MPQSSFSFCLLFKSSRYFLQFVLTKGKLVLYNTFTIIC